MALATNTSPGEIQLAGDLAGNNDATAPELSNSGVTAGQYNFAQLTVDSKGRVTSASGGDVSLVSAQLPLATTSVAGVFKIGDGLAVNAGSATSGYQEIDFTSTITGGNASGLNNCAWYSLDIQVDFGSTQSISIDGANLSTYNDVVSQLSSNITGATASIVGDKIKIESDTTGRSSSVVIITDKLFECMTNYNQIETAIFGSENADVYVPDATTGSKGKVQIGTGIDVTAGVISVNLAGVTPAIATTTTLGGVIVPTSGSIDIDGSGNISVPNATSSSLGVVEVPGGDGLSVDGSGNLSFSYTAATTGALGAVQVPTSGNLDIDGSGNLSVPAATNSTLGVVSVGAGLNVTGSGELSVDTSVPLATTTTAGIVIVPTSGNIDVDGSGNISVPDADGSTKGVVQIGSNISVSAGTISVAAASGATTLGVVRSADTNHITITSGNIDLGPKVATLDTNNTWEGVQSQTPVTLSDGATINTDCSQGNLFEVTLGGNRTLANPTNLQDGAKYTWAITQDGTGGRTLTYGSAFKWKNGASNTLTGTAGAIEFIVAYCDGTNLYASLSGEFS